MKVNGKQVEYTAGTLLDLLQREGYNPERVVVERAREIITKEQFSSVMLAQDDEINVLHFMGGG